MAQGLADLVLARGPRTEEDPTLKSLSGSLGFSSVSDTFALVSAAVERKNPLPPPPPAARAAPSAATAAAAAAAPALVAPRARRSPFADMTRVVGLESPAPVASPAPTPRRERERPPEEKKREETKQRDGFEAMYRRPNRASEFHDRQDQRRAQVDRAEKKPTLKDLMRFVDSLVSAVGLKSKYALYRLDFDAGDFTEIPGLTEIDWREVVDESYWPSIDLALKDARRFAPKFAGQKTDFVLLTTPRAASSIRDIVQFYFTKNTAATKGRYMQPSADSYIDTLYSNAAFDLRELDGL